MGFVYECMDRTKGQIANACDNDQSQYQQIWEIVDKRWTMLHRPLHVAGVFLVPNYFHVHKDVDIMEGFYTCVERMYLDPKIQKKTHLKSLTFMNGTNHSFITT